MQKTRNAYTIGGYVLVTIGTIAILTMCFIGIDLAPSFHFFNLSQKQHAMKEGNSKGWIPVKTTYSQEQEMKKFTESYYGKWFKK